MMNTFENKKTIGNVEFDFFRQTASCAGRLIELTAKEFGLLWILSANAGQSFSRNELKEAIWTGRVITDRIVDTNICRLRPKLRKLFATDIDVVKTDRQKGYSIKHSLLEKTDG